MKAAIINTALFLALFYGTMHLLLSIDVERFDVEQMESDGEARE